MNGRSKVLTWGLPTVGLAALVGGVSLVVADRPLRPAETPPRTPTVAPTEADGARTDRFIGAVGLTEPPGEAVQIGAHRGGIVESVEAAAGRPVARGAVLFVVDTRQAHRAVEVAEGELAVARADVEALRGQIGPARADVASARASEVSALAAVGAASAEADDRAMKLEVAEAVGDARAISEEEVATRRFAVAQARARLAQAEGGVAEARAAIASAEARLALLVDPSGGDGPEIRAAEQRVGQSAAGLEQARTELELLTVRSPVEGRVIQVNVRAGEFAPAKELTEGLVVVAPLGATRVRAQIDEVDISRWGPEARAWATPRGDAARRMELRLAFAEPLVVPKRALAGRTDELVDTRVLEVLYELPPEAGDIALGQQMDIYIEATGGGR